MFQHFISNNALVISIILSLYILPIALNTMLAPIRISVVSYLNSKPFLYGLQHYKLQSNVQLSLDTPAVCAQKLIDNNVDLGLVPIAILPQINPHYIISDYCIGAKGKVDSVMLYSDVPLNQIKTILLDYQSKTSVTLVKILAKRLWNIAPLWENATKNFETHISNTTAAVIIGDRTFDIGKKYAYTYDLSEEWEKLTGLPFVFACWVANKKLPDVFLKEFNHALKFGIDNRPKLISELIEQQNYLTDIDDYLTNKISYNFDTDKKQAMKLFLDYRSTI